MAKVTPAIFKARLSNAIEHMESPTAITEVALLVEAEAKEQISGPLRAVATGTLRRDINHAVSSRERAVVGNNVDYAIYVHEGTKYMKARPYLVEALRQAVNSGKITQVLQKFGRSWLAKFTG